ncbi:MAG: hypothetical protein JRN26_05415 [Nitrososphaerota archaeon]|jgi:hypothetical protein|nr:hypothetical protein [Nitrososphaerota archaeon]MDG6928186.1 hypothetical protein [Nitrososphaerota archaeon]MDG6930800.1 hypothetical protein [Nitrososphaerota archaeon]MDG6932967.1 hypothetical protein [Nitrososphaerota archaeon]MDG6936302.1 hypothetical protein [Nitrososphaerota archaeon]
MSAFFGLGDIGEAIAGKLNGEGVEFPLSPVVIFNLGDRRAEQVDEAGMYVGISPFSFEVERRFRASIQLQRLVGHGVPVLVVDMDSYEDRMKNSELSTIGSIIVEEISELLKALANSGEGLQHLNGGAHLIFTQKDSNDMASLALTALRMTESIKELHVLVMDGSLSPAEASDIVKRLTMMSVPVSLSYVGNRSIMAEIVEGRLKLLDNDIIQKVLGDRVLDLEPEEAVSVPIPSIERID